MSQPSIHKMHELGLDAGEYQRLRSWMPELAVELSPPGTKVRRTESGVRVGNKGSLSVSDGGWYSFEADKGGRDPLSLMQFLQADAELAELRRVAVEWLRAHPSRRESG
jgi:hypothetical protein